MSIVVQKKRASRAILAVLLFSALLICLPTLPLIEEMPTSDAGVFLYVGQAITKGLTPYVDAWDHKGIVVYWVNAAASLLSPNSLWGIWIINLVLLLTTVIASFQLISRLFGNHAALWIELAWLFILPSIKFFDHVEFYALFLQFLALSCFYASTTKEHDRKYAFVLGILFALTFFIRANLIAIFGAVILYWLWGILSSRKRNAAIQRLIYMTAGTGVSCILFAVYFLASHSLEAMIDIVFRYNILYAAASASLEGRLAAMFYGVRFLSYSGLSFLGAAGWLVSAVILARSSFAKTNLSAVVVIALITLPFEVVFSSISGVSYPHYYLTWLPSFSILGAFFIKWIRDHFGKQPSGIRLSLSRFFGVLAVVGIGVAPLLGIVDGFYTFLTPLNVSHVLHVIQAETKTGDTLLVWGSESGLNYLSGRLAPTRYVYQYPLFLQGYESPARFEEFLTEIQRDPPKLVIDASATSSMIPPLNAEARAQWHNTGEARYVINSDVDQVLQYFVEHYKFLTVTDYEWVVYSRRD